MRAKPYGDPGRKVHDVGERNEATGMCGNVEMWISTNRALAAKKCGSEHLAAIFCPSLLHLLPLSSPLKLPYGMFPFCRKKEHAKTCSTVNRILLTH